MSRLRNACRLGPVLVVAATLVAKRTWAQPAAARPSVPPSDAEQSEARERYTRAMQLVEEGKHDVALIEMQRAYSLSPSYRILYNLGRIQSHLGDCAAALGSYERYLAEGGPDVPAPRATEVGQEIASCRSRVGTVEVLVKDEGAEVLVDDVVIGRGPFRKAILTNAGKHRFGASKRGMQPIARVLAVAGGDKLMLELELPSTASPSAPRPVASAAPAVGKPAVNPVEKPAIPDHPANGDYRSQGSGLVWIGWSLTGALAAGGVVAAVMARKTASELSDLRETAGTTRQALDDKEAATFRSAVLTDVLLGAAVLAGGFSLYYSLSSRSVGTAPRGGNSLQVAIHSGGVRLFGAF